MSNIAILLNPSAGRGRALRRKERLEALLRRYEIGYKIFISKSEGHLRNLATATSRYYKTIVGVGGDGTFDIIINELMREGHGNTFGMVALGSSNDIVREFGVDSLEKACSAIKSGKTKETDLGVVTAEGSEPLYFLGTASVGLGTTVNRYVKELIRRQPILARSQFIDGLLGVYDSFATKKVPIRLTLKYDSASITSDFSLVVFNNTSFYARIKPSPDAIPYDGLLDCCCTTAESFHRFSYVYFLARRGKHTNQQGVRLIKAQEFKILSEAGVEIQTDGEVRGPYKHITISVKPKALRVIVNPDYIASK